jgi:pre-mRNA-splicing factor SYF1
VRHGNEDTIREMLRVKRSVQAMYNTQFTAHLIAQQTQLAGSNATISEESGASANKENAGELIEEPEKLLKRPDQVSFVRGDTFVPTHNVEASQANPDEINLDDDDENNENEETGD